MFIILNHNTHTYVACNYPEQVTKALADMKADVDESEMLTVLCGIDEADESVCMNPRQFMETWGADVV